MIATVYSYRIYRNIGIIIPSIIGIAVVNNYRYQIIRNTIPALYIVHTIVSLQCPRNRPSCTPLVPPVPLSCSTGGCRPTAMLQSLATPWRTTCTPEARTDKCRSRDIQRRTIWTWVCSSQRSIFESPWNFSEHFEGGFSATTNCPHNDNCKSTVIMMNFFSQDLACGQTYQAHIVANNKVGSSTPSVVVTAKTKGGRPGVPKKSLFLKPNSTYLRLNLEAWPDNDCPIDRFVVRHRPMLQPHWTTSECIIFIYY